MRTVPAKLPGDDAKFGPKMEALNERQRKFVVALFIVKPGHGSAVRAARSAGFGTDKSSAQTMASIASRLMHDDRIIEATREYGERFLKAAGPAALRALEKLILTPSHKDHGRAVAAVVDRLYPMETQHNLNVEHNVGPGFKETAEVMARIADLAAKFRVSLPAPTVINASPNEVDHVDR
jgi:phage terminase small subunit